MTKYNVDPRFNPITTTLGFIIVACTVLVVYGIYFFELKEEPNYWIICPFGALGIVLIVSPDNVIGIIANGFKSMFNKFFGK